MAGKRKRMGQMRIKVLQALHYDPPLPLNQASAITLTKIKCVQHVMSLYILQGSKEISETVFKFLSLFFLVPLPKYVYSVSCQNFPTEKTGRQSLETLAVCIVHTYKYGR